MLLISSLENQIPLSRNTVLDLIGESNSKPVIEVPLRRSDRVSHQSDRYYGFLIQNRDSVELDENNEDLITYVDAMQRSNSDK